MNRRDFLSAGFKLGAAGLLLPVIEPVRKVWALDRTMVPGQATTNVKFFMFDGSGEGYLVGDSFVWTTLSVTNPENFQKHDLIWIGSEPMRVMSVNNDANQIAVLRGIV